jgi:hypothetical protein
MFVIYVQTKFFMPSSSNSLVIAIKQKSKYTLHAAAILVFYYILQKYYLNKTVCYQTLFLNSYIKWYYCHSHLTKFSILYYQLWKIKKSTWDNIHTKLLEIL